MAASASKKSKWTYQVHAANYTWIAQNTSKSWHIPGIHFRNSIDTGFKPASIADTTLLSFCRNRENTVRCIVSSLTEEGSGCDLSEELHSLPVSGTDPDDPEYMTGHWRNWQPDPVDAKPSTFVCFLFWPPRPAPSRWNLLPSFVRLSLILSLHMLPLS